MKSTLIDSQSQSENKSKLSIRHATEADMPAVFGLVKELAEFERVPQQVETSVEQYLKDGFGAIPWFRCLVAETEAKEIIGMAFYYFGYSTWKGRMLYLEDFMVRRSHRRQGIGRQLIDTLVQIGLEENIQLMKWEVIEWNEGAKAMYRSMGGELDGEWINVKLQRSQLEKRGVGSRLE